METLSSKRIGFAVTASYCTFSKVLQPLEELVQAGAAVTPILSFQTSGVDSRFMPAAEFRYRVESITGTKSIDTIAAAEPIGPKALFDLIIVAPCTGNTLAKLACGITDTPVTMACKAHLRNERPVLLAVSSNDALTASAANIGRLLNTKRYYFVPMRQDDWVQKPASLVADMNKVVPAALSALGGVQLQPVLLG